MDRVTSTALLTELGHYSAASLGFFGFGCLGRGRHEILAVLYPILRVSQKGSFSSLMAFATMHIFLPR